MTNICMRLSPGSRLREAIYDTAEKHHIKAGIILTCVGSLEKLNIRLAGAEKFFSKTEKYEIVSLTGTFNDKREGHFHISVADKAGNCYGGHLLANNIIATTAEIVIAIIPETSFHRENDPKTGYKELVIKHDILR